MFTLWGIYPLLLLSAACFTFSAIMEIFIHIPHEKRPREVSVFQVIGMDLKESYRFVKTEKPIFFSVVFLVSIFNLVLSAVMIVGTPILITQVLGMSDTMYGFTQGALALGGLCGGVLTAIVSEKLKLQKSYVLLLVCSAAVAVMGISLLLNMPAIVSYWVITLMSFAAVYTLYGTDLYDGTDTNTATISRKDYGGANLYCDVRPTDRSGDLWSLIRHFCYAHMGSINWWRSCSTFDFSLFKEDTRQVGK